MPTGDHWFVLGRRIGEQTHQVSVFLLMISDARDTRAFAESLAKLAIASPLLMFLPTLRLLHILFPVRSETSSRSLSTRWRCSAFRSEAVLDLLNFTRSVTQSGQYPFSPMSIRPTCCGRQEQVKLAMEVVERKVAKRRAK